MSKRPDRPLISKKRVGRKRRKSTKNKKIGTGLVRASLRSSGRK